ncbi:SDR family NAD(P)-dependent oxidoreductase [Nonomuraea sp. LPB2021202275-12-8]|uniref:SDR family NAD(P)-dependent oxidoreductase n=1 Tax=Nonomuraea sp. LPB2021202275-12-8 TaxID=3120159 RepID=UPI00300D768B
MSGGRLAGYGAIITGAGQTPGRTIGNGRATALVFAREGARVVLVDRDLDSMRATAKLVEEQGGVAVTVQGDVTVAADWEAAVATCVERFGRLDVVHHNVGVAIRDGSPTSVEQADWARNMMINSGSVLLMAQAVLPVMRAAERGVITNVSSIAAVAVGASPGNPPIAYKMSKAAMNAATQAMALENAGYGIRVNAIMPGLIDTPLGVDLGAAARGMDRDEYAARRHRRVPLKGGMGTAWDVANAALFLASEEARFVTGVLLPVDGGQSARIG